MIWCNNKKCICNSKNKCILSNVKLSIASATETNIDLEEDRLANMMMCYSFSPMKGVSNEQ